MARRRRRRYAGSRWEPYVPVAQRRKASASAASRAARAGLSWDPVRLIHRGHAIARTPWGRAWCVHLERLRDYDNRLPRGRSYVRNGSVVHLEILEGEIRAKVMGSTLYEQRVRIAPCDARKWNRLVRTCAGDIGSLIELLEGRFSSEVMARMTDPAAGLLPDLGQVEMSCSCPDWAVLCKHLAAVLYGVGARLDEQPSLLFTLRGTDPAALVANAGMRLPAVSDEPEVEGDLGELFGIDLVPAEPVSAPDAHPKSAPRKRAARTVTRQELLAAGVPGGTICTWLRSGLLLATEVRGAYRHTRESRARMKGYG